MNLLKNIRLIILVALVLVSVLFLVTPLLTKASGVVVVSVENDSKCFITEGSVINQVSGDLVANSDDFKNAEKNTKENVYVPMVVNNGPGGCVAARDGYLGINVADVSTKHLIFGIDIQGGIVNIFKPVTPLSSEQLNKVVETIIKRIQILNLAEMNAYASDDLINIVSLSSEKIGMLVMPGEFEAKILRDVNLVNDTGELGIGNDTYPFKIVNDTSITINSDNYGLYQKFYLENIEFRLINITNNTASIEATILNNEDVKNLLTSYSYVKYDQNYNSYEFNIPLEISAEASDRFVKITKKLPTTYVMGRPTLEGFLVYYIDGEVINKLSIPFDMMGKKLDNIAVVGFKKTMQEASNEKLRVEVAVSGKLPAELRMVGTKKFEPILREKFLWSTALIFAIIVLSVSLLGYLRYKKIKLGAYIVLLVLAEVVCTLGVASAVQMYYSYGWVLDTKSIIGFFVLMVTSSVQMILLTEKAMKKKDYAIYFKFKKILGATTLLNIAVFTLAFSMLFAWKGFGLALIIGFTIGALITKPIYDDVLKKISSAAVS